MLETLRAYADQRLDEAGERAQIQAAHAAYYTRLATETEPRLRGADQDQALAVLRGDRDNLRAALAWGRAHPAAELGLRLAAALGWFWYFTSAQEGIGELEAMLAAALHAPPGARARALLALAVVARPGSCIVHPDPRCAAAARAGRELFAADGDTLNTAYCETLLAVEGIDGPDPAGSLRLLDEAAVEFDRAGDRWGHALELFVRMELQFLAGDADAATAHGARALELFRTLDDHWGISAVQYHHGLALHRAGRLDAALAVHEAALAQGRRGLTNTVPYALADLGHVALELGDHDRAERHFTEATVIARQLGAEGSPAAALGQGHLARQRGDLDTAARHYHTALHLLAGRGTPEWEAAAHNGLGFVTALVGDLPAAEAHHRTAWQTASRAPAAGARAAATALEGLACTAAARGDATLAAALLGTAARWRRWRHQPALRIEAADITRATDRARGLLGDTGYERAYARGLQPPPDAVVDLQQPVEAQLAAWLREPAHPG
jgi:tetratricopeptide (TPR) repeat protein